MKSLLHVPKEMSSNQFPFLELLHVEVCMYVYIYIDRKRDLYIEKSHYIRANNDISNTKTAIL